MKVLVLPRESCKKLQRLLFRFYIRNEFSHLTQRLSIYFKNQKIKLPENSQRLMLLINRIFLTNIYKYIDLRATSWFVESMSNCQVGSELNVESLHVFELVRDMTGLTVSDYDNVEIENLVCREISTFMAFIYSEEASSFNETLMEVFDMMQCYIPREGIRVHRFEITPNLDPLLFYTDKVVHKEAVYESICTQ